MKRIEDVVTYIDLSTIHLSYKSKYFFESTVWSIFTKSENLYVQCYQIGTKPFVSMHKSIYHQYFLKKYGDYFSIYDKNLILEFTESKKIWGSNNEEKLPLEEFLQSVKQIKKIKVTLTRNFESTREIFDILEKIQTIQALNVTFPYFECQKRFTWTRILGFNSTNRYKVFFMKEIIRNCNVYPLTRFLFSYLNTPSWPNLKYFNGEYLLSPRSNSGSKFFNKAQTVTRINLLSHGLCSETPFLPEILNLYGRNLNCIYGENYFVLCQHYRRVLNHRHISEMNKKYKELDFILLPGYSRYNPPMIQNTFTKRIKNVYIVPIDSLFGFHDFQRYLDIFTNVENLILILDHLPSNELFEQHQLQNLKSIHICMPKRRLHSIIDPLKDVLSPGIVKTVCPLILFNMDRFSIPLDLLKVHGWKVRKPMNKMDLISHFDSVINSQKSTESKPKIVYRNNSTWKDGFRLFFIFLYFVTSFTLLTSTLIYKGDVLLTLLFFFLFFF